MTQPTPDPARGAEVAALDRAHVFHSWSRAGRAQPAADRRRPGLLRLGLRRQPLPRLLQPAGQRQHRPPAPQGRRGDPGAGRPSWRRSPRSTPTTARGEAAQAHRRRWPPTGFDKVFFTNGGADANENAIRMARLHTGRDKVLSFYRSLPRQHRRGDRRDRRLAALAQRVRQRPRALLRAVPVPHRRSGPTAESEESRARAATTSSRSSSPRARRRSRRSCSRPSSAPPACSIPPPGYLAGRPRAVRPVRHRAASSTR